MAAAIYLYIFYIFYERAAVRGTLKMVKGNGTNCPYENSLLLYLDNIGSGYRYCAAEKNEAIVSHKFIHHERYQNRLRPSMVEINAYAPLTAAACFAFRQTRRASASCACPP
jgi:hypothetical protein